jgi:hypothetical protein
MRYTVTSIAVALALLAYGGLIEASAASRLGYRHHTERTGSHWDYYGYPRPNCTFAIAQYQRTGPAQLWPPSMRCFPYPSYPG